MKKISVPMALSVALLASSAHAQHRAEKRLPVTFDLCKDQTAIRNQGARDTCPYFPPVAALEAAYNRAGIKVDLSSEHLLWLRNTASFSGDSGNRDGNENMCSVIGGGNGLSILQQFAICRDQDLPYHGSGEVLDMSSAYYKGFELNGYEWSKPFAQFLLNRWNLDPRQLPQAARRNARYAIEKYETVPREALKSPRTFEEILASGHEIIFGLNIHDRSDDSGRGEPVWKLKPHTNRGPLHFMLMVGYNRHRRFFVVKNQWGPVNYSGRVARLARDWKDVIKYDGYTLIDYNYLPECTEAHYITQVAPVGSPRFTPQRALGQWRVTFSQKKKTLKTGVLCWRHIPGVDGSKPNLRVGELVLADGGQYRVNARLDREGPSSFKITLFIDFANGYLSTDSAGGTAWTGRLTLPDDGGGSLNAESGPRAEIRLWQASDGSIELSAQLVENENLLMGLKSVATPLRGG